MLRSNVRRRNRGRAPETAPQQSVGGIQNFSVMPASGPIANDQTALLPPQAVFIPNQQFPANVVVPTTGPATDLRTIADDFLENAKKTGVISYKTFLPGKSFMLSLPSFVFAFVSGYIYIIPTAQYSQDRTLLGSEQAELIMRELASVGINVTLAYFCNKETGKILFFGEFDLSSREAKAAWQRLKAPKSKLAKAFVAFLALLSTAPQVSLGQTVDKVPDNLPGWLVKFLKKNATVSNHSCCCSCHSISKFFGYRWFIE